MPKGLPYFTKGEVVKGFGRGSKELGCPTANYPQDVVDNLPNELENGVYFGYASVDNGPVYKMVMSIGWNPFYKNTKKSMETHILHEFNEDFYGSTLKTLILGYLRDEKDFKSLDDLKMAIKNDIEQAEKELNKEEYLKYKQHDFFNS